MVFQHDSPKNTIFRFCDLAFYYNNTIKARFVFDQDRAT